MIKSSSVSIVVKRFCAKTWESLLKFCPMLSKNGCSSNFAKFTGKHLCPNLFFNKVARLRHLDDCCMVVALNYFVTVTLIGKKCCKISEQDLFLEMLLNIRARSFSGSIFSRAECWKH